MLREEASRVTDDLPVGRGAARWWIDSLDEYVRRFPGRDPVSVIFELPVPSALAGMAALRTAMGVADDVVAGDRVVLTPGCLYPIKGEVAYATPTLLGVRTDDALYRFYVHEPSGSAIGVTHHLFADEALEAPSVRAWRGWLRGLFDEARAACLTGRVPGR